MKRNRNRGECENVRRQYRQNMGICAICGIHDYRTKYKGEYLCRECLNDDKAPELQIYSSGNLSYAQELEGGGFRVRCGKKSKHK